MFHVYFLYLAYEYEYMCEVSCRRLKLWHLDQLLVLLLANGCRCLNSRIPGAELKYPKKRRCDQITTPQSRHQAFFSTFKALINVSFITKSAIICQQWLRVYKDSFKTFFWLSEVQRSRHEIRELFFLECPVTHDCTQAGGLKFQIHFISCTCSVCHLQTVQKSVILTFVLANYHFVFCLGMVTQFQVCII